MQPAASPALMHSTAREGAPAQPEPVKPASEKSVMFDLQPQEWEFDAEAETACSGRDVSKERERERDGRRRGQGRHADRGGERGSGHRDHSPASSHASDETIELPPRFDELGRARDRDGAQAPLAATLESVLAGLFR